MIYCVEDDAGIRNMMLYTLNSAGLQAKGFSDSNAFWQEMQNELPDLILLDLMLPGGDDGLTILNKLKQKPSTENIPVIIATAKGEEYDRVIGLDSGADDYLCKPFGMMEMVSRVKAVLRRTKKSSTSILCYNDLTLNDERHEVTACGKIVELTLKEYEILRLFMENIGQAFSRDKILSYIWGVDFFGETRTVDVHIGTLRTKIGKCGEYIQTVRGIGYKMEKN
ncbi:MAG: response regulator transcription factor [Clostridia bacterium]|nr:response regulator transcription factor [Clostridia bacterium]